MKIYKQTFPWRHWIIDDFINSKDVNILSHFCKKCIKNKNVKQSYNPEYLEEPYKTIVQKTIDKMPYTTNLFDSEPARNSEKIYPLGHLAINTAGYSFPPHCDDKTKIWTFVTYVGPLESIGTFVMSNNQQRNKIQIPWQPGRCLVLCGNDNETWHSYESGNNWRATITAYMNTDKNWGK